MRRNRRRVGVCGGRNYQDRAKVFRTLDAMHDAQRITMIVHGACTDPETQQLAGADRWAEEWAILRQVRYSGEPAQWHIYGRGAGPIRNELIALHYALDELVAFPGNSGTANMIKNAEKSGIAVKRVK